MNLLAIDQSTSATKALVYDADFRVVERASVSHPSIFPQAGWVEQDAGQIYHNTLAVIEQVAKGNGIACVSITNQRETFVLFDRKTGVPVHNAVVWQCRRGDAVCAELKPHEAMIAERTGLRLDSYFSASKITALLRARPDLAAGVNDGQILIGTVDTYLIYRLTGGKVFATDVTNASRTLLFNLAARQWDADLCRLFGVNPKALAEVRDSTATFGKTEAGIPIAGAIGDSQAALLGHGCVGVGASKVTLGTGSSILLNTGDRLADAGDAAVQAVAWSHGGRPTYCLEGIINYSAATVAWLKDGLGLIQSADECEAAARSVADNGGVYLVPAFGGLGAPHWLPQARAAIVGMSTSANRNHVIRAALEAIAYQINDALQVMQQGSGVKLTRLHADGGATRNRFLMQFLADVTGVEIVVSRNADCSSLGAAMAGAVGMGLYSSLADAAARPREAESFKPAMSRDAVEKLTAGWQRAVRQVLTQ